MQQTLETALTTLLRQPVEVTGCGRTDAGVHARHYVGHFDAETPLPDRFLQAANSLLPSDIAVQACAEVAPDAHARYDAFERSYTYTITLEKDPFQLGTAWFFPQGRRLDIGRMQEVAALLTQFEDFAPFCKSDSGLKHFRCQNLKARWELSGASTLEFNISANRFLRGMVRLIVGASIYTGLGKMTPEDIRNALEQQSPLSMPMSVPPVGLALTGVRYPFPF